MSIILLSDINEAYTINYRSNTAGSIVLLNHLSNGHSKKKIISFHREYIFICFFPVLPHVPYGLRGLPSRLWPKCNRLLRLGRPSGAVTLS
jgi:hypothetical protein